MNKRKYANHPTIAPSADVLSRSTVQSHVRTLRAFFNWLNREELFCNDISKNLKPPKVPAKVISTLSDAEIKAIINTFNKHDPVDMRNQTIFVLMIDTGMRIGEIINLKLEGMNQGEGILVVMGKGQKERIVPVGNTAWKSLQKYLFRYRPKAVQTGITNIFLTAKGRPITETSMKLMFGRLARRSGVERLHAHLCRHTFATMFLANGGDIFSLQKILGHTTLEMVRHYANVSTNQIIMQHSKYSPLDRINLAGF